MNSTANSSITVLGAGSWGTALAILLARHGIRTLLWTHSPDHARQMVDQRHNPRYLSAIPFPETLIPTGDLAAALAESSEVLVVVPSHAFRATIRSLAPLLRPGMSLAWATKGLEPGSKKLLHEIVAEELGSDYPCTVISGPTFATEVAKGLPTAVTVASTDAEVAARFAAMLHGNTFRAYTSDDVVGVELGGAIKNVLAIAAGIADGLGFGANTRAALITRGLAEMMRLGITLGGKPETFMGLAGLGDLVLTCTDDQSRNRRLGLALGRGNDLTAAIESIGQVVEGVKTAAEVHELSRSLGVEMPITSQVYSVLYQQLPPPAAVQNLLGREQKAENHI